MVLRLDSRFAVVWRDPFSLQFGVDPAVVVLRDVTGAQERMIAALGSGVSRSGLEMLAANADKTRSDTSVRGEATVGEAVVADLLKKLAPVLRESEAPAQAPRVALVGTGPTVDRIAGILSLAGVRVAVSTTCIDDDSDLGIAVGHYVLDPESYGFWLRRDRPHLPVLFGDDSVTMGPLVDAGRTPCLYCLEHYRRDTDASWSAIASQLWGRRAASETPLVSIEVAARVSRMVLARLAGGQPRGRPMSARSFRLTVSTGEVTRRDWMPHPECGCVTVPSGFGAGEPHNETPYGFSADRPENDLPRGQVRPRTVAADVGRA